MRRLWITFGAILISFIHLSLTWAQGSLPAEVAQLSYADMIVVNGKVVSMDDAGVNTNAGTVYEAMAVKGGRILALGTTERIRSLAGSNTKVVDLQGQLVMPGIIETHSHLYGGSGGSDIEQQLGIRSPDRGMRIAVKAGKDIEATRLVIENGIKDAITKIQPGDWVVVGVNANMEEGISGKRLISWTVAEDLEPRLRLDRISPENPVLVQTGTRGNLNTKGLDLAVQFMPEYRAYIGQSLGKEYSDAPEKGLVGSQEIAALNWQIWYNKLPLSLLAEMVRRQLERTAAYGITTFSSRVPQPKIMSVFTWLNREKQMPIRFQLLYEVARYPQSPDIIRQIYRMTGNLTGLGDDWMWIGGVASERWDTDFPQACLGPDVEASPDIKKREVCPQPGQMWWDTLQNALESGWRLAGIHGEGSHGVRLFIQMIELAMKNTGMTVEDVRKLRMTMEHSPVIGQMPDVMAGLKKYNMIISASPGYFADSPDYVQDYGPKVMPFLMPLKTLMNNGVKVVGQNTPRNVGRLWLRFMTRTVPGGTFLPEEALDRVIVAKMYTRWASEYVMKENEMGSLEVGKFADFVVLDKDYFTIPQNDIPKIRPQMTVIDGTIKHLDTAYATKLGMEPVGFQFPPNHTPWDEGEMGGG
ncbi:MAG: amidohydrolase family protein [Acidobacteria bacterium]|nr:amidohydrolase family protein [Acidobacteriota bacterium]